MADLEIGAAAPDFTLPSDTDGDVTLSALRGHKVVLYFYPKDSTPGCTTQACDFRDRKEAFAGEGAVVLGVSKDSLESHGRFRSKHELNFPLLSDADLEVHKAYGAYGEKKNYGKTYMGVIRTTVVVDAEGRIASYKRNVKAKGNAERTLGLV
jgi:thioredoxin-dependent peroxiredoxin